MSAKKKAKGKSEKTAKESAKRNVRISKKAVDMARVREAINNMVGNSAEKIATEVINVALTGQVAQAKYLFEAVGLYPATEETAARPQGDSLAHILLRRMGLPLESVNPAVDLCFPIVHGLALEVDHGHALYLALRAICGNLERIPGLGIHTVRGMPGGQKGELILTDESEVRLRIPAGSAPLLKDLAGVELDVNGREIRLGEPYPQALTPVSALWARTVTIHFRELALGAAQAQLAFRFNQDFPWGGFRILRPRTIRIEGRSHRAAASHAGGPGFESLRAHHFTRV